ncbi:hypothetical protein CQ12_11505 [Bradyrhizobium jicamae]|uniref:DUF1353 domain-containing protein n=1 Tax=Bradyrhizobium jicamae TaxID=280332 RepID=A0A0R3LK54_9BRAD|nr:DUF1353 domain-containing protein [Bradyrhizobium jicamae]KRR06205.1 hypothetical protein CQ12_11505 [Bradyrhizobium jicamae]
MTVRAGTQKSRREVLATILAIPFLSATSGLAYSEGKFVGKVAAEWIDDSRRMRLLAPFEFIDANGRRWPVPAGTIIDGASIPRVFWSVIGGPFEGAYRGPSVIHDYFCDVRTRKYPEVHLNFHECMLAAGVSPSLAWLMYRAVAVFGPKWPDPKIPAKCEIVGKDYDFDFCTQNAVRPEATTPSATKAELQAFANGLEGKVDPADLAKLRQSIDATP